MLDLFNLFKSLESKSIVQKLRRFIAYGFNIIGDKVYINSLLYIGEEIYWINKLEEEDKVYSSLGYS